ncbi:MAG: energy transducer TonB [Acidobacteria bacterium]|nr:energy transducer TonB [Acidobacteriota bacterium]
MRKILSAAIFMLIVATSTFAQKEQPAAPKFTPVEIISAVEAAYPVNSVAEGTVILEVTVNPEGEIENVRVLKDIPSLTEPAKKAVHNWKFKAATWRGKSVAATIAVSFAFRTVVRY